MSFINTKMKVSKKVQGTNGKNEYQEIGVVPFFIPGLAEFGIEAPIKQDDNGVDSVDEDNLPIYADEKADYLFSALVQYVKMSVRNKLVPGTVELKSGAVIPESWEQFLAESTGRGEALKIISEAKKAFSTYVQGLEKKPEVKNAIIGLFSNRQALTLQNGDTKGKFVGYISAFAEGLEENDLDRYSRYLSTLEEACQVEEISLD